MPPDVRVLLLGTALLLLLMVPRAAGRQTTGSPTPTPPLVPASMRGADLYRLYCATCHGRDGTGHGPVASSMKIEPSDLTRIAMRNSGLFPRARVEALVSGGETVGAHGSSDMPVWGPIFRGLDDSEARVKVRIANLVSFVESIQKK